MVTRELVKLQMIFHVINLVFGGFVFKKLGISVDKMFIVYLWIQFIIVGVLAGEGLI